MFVNKVLRRRNQRRTVRLSVGTDQPCSLLPSSSQRADLRRLKRRGGQSSVARLNKSAGTRILSGFKTLTFGVEKVSATTWDREIRGDRRVHLMDHNNTRAWVGGPAGRPVNHRVRSVNAQLGRFIVRP